MLKSLPWTSVVDLRKDLTLAPVNKVHHVHTITRVAELLGEDEDWLSEVADEMDQEGGLIWVHGPGETCVMAFNDFGIETVVGLLEIHKAEPGLLKRATDPKGSREASAQCGIVRLVGGTESKRQGNG